MFSSFSLYTYIHLNLLLFKICCWIEHVLLFILNPRFFRFSKCCFLVISVQQVEPPSVPFSFSDLGMNWKWMSTSNLTWPLLMDSRSLATRVTRSLVMEVSRCLEVMRPHMLPTTGLPLITKQAHLKVNIQTDYIWITSNTETFLHCYQFKSA